MKLDADTVREALKGREADIIAGLLPDGRTNNPNGREWFALAPGRDDRHLGSFSVSLDTGLWHDFASGEGGDLFDLVRNVTGCDFAGALQYLARACGISAPDPRLTIRRPGGAAVAEWKRCEASGESNGRGCTPAQLAECKKLPLQFLSGLGLKDLPAREANGDRPRLPECVVIPYHSRAGDHVATRFRSDITAKLGTKWKVGDKPTLYGVDRLAGDESRVLLVEGESDCWCCWYAGIVALGIPGASNWKDEWSSLLPDGATIHVVQEPDGAGAALVKALSTSPIANRLRVVRLTAKDPADLWVGDPDVERFRKAMESAMDAAQPVTSTLTVVDPVTAPPVIVMRTHADRVRDRLAPRLMVIAGILPAGGIGALIAMPGIGKTLVGIEQVRCVASGEPFAGHAVRRGRVVYACPDSPASTERRMLAIPAEVAEHIITVCDLPRLPDGLPALRTAIEREHFIEPIVLVVIDTWDSAREHGGGGYADQDGAVEMIMSGLRTMGAELGIAFVIIHHATRADGGRARGPVGFDARADFIGIVEQTPDGISLRSQKCRDGESGHVGAWRIVPVDVAGMAVPTLEAITGRVQTVAKGMPRNARMVLDALAGWDDETAPTKAQLVMRSTVAAGSMGKALDYLREAGLVERDSYRLTDAGRENDESVFGATA